ncbi:glyceraldehyde 3-phosphate dehydrogenase (phosphorylating) [Pancytospora epiphaga]|nr:glyceraldehyde 3-phosphate dehydrogenase (phosphorylating) [Pancytospora epiphaga]
MKVGINGFGRIGKSIYKILVENNIEVPLVNDPFINIKYMEYLLKYDTVNGKFKCHCENSSIIVNGIKTHLSNETLQEKIMWMEYGVDYVVEATGVFLTKEECEKHRCKRVVLTAPSKDIPMYVYGVNHVFIGEEKVISAASCTTNCLAPLVKLLHESYGIEEGLMTTVHAVTATQKITDGNGSKWRSSRSAMNIIPATTGAATAVCAVLPELEGKLNGMSFRVPVLNGSVVDLVVRLQSCATLADIRSMIEASGMKDVIGCTTDQVVSSDIIGDSRSSVVDINASMQLNPKFFKIVSWYDNEHGYSSRVVDLLKYIEYK